MLFQDVAPHISDGFARRATPKLTMPNIMERIDLIRDPVAWIGMDDIFDWGFTYLSMSFWFLGFFSETVIFSD